LGQCTKRFTAHFPCKDQSIRRHEDDERASTDSAQRDSAFGCGLLTAQLGAQEQKAAASKSAPAAKKSSGSAAATNAPPAAVHGQELTEADLSAFLDGLVPQQIEKADIAGAVIAVVKDGKVLFEKGYGYSDAE